MCPMMITLVTFASLQRGKLKTSSFNNSSSDQLRCNESSHEDMDQTVKKHDKRTKLNITKIMKT